MHHPWIRPPDFWRDGAPLEPWELEQLDQAVADGVNGDDGEEFDADTQIAIGGDGVIVTASFRAQDCRRFALVPATPLDVVTRSISRYQDLGRGTPVEPDNWLYQSTSGFRPHWSQRVADLDQVWIPLALPVGSTLTSLRMTLKGAPGHSGLPVTMPRVSLMEADPDDITPFVVGSTDDTSADVTAFELIHTVTHSASTVVAADKRYYARIRGEAQVNAVNGLRLFALRATCSITTYDAWIT